MAKLTALFTAALLAGCLGQTKNNEPLPNNSDSPPKKSEYVWEKLLDSAAWKKNYNFQLFSIQDTVWTFHPQGTWFSVDGGLNWAKTPLPNAIHNLAFLDYIYFKGAMYGLGHFEGNIETFSFEPYIFKTTDFNKWEIVSEKSNLPRRFFYHPFVFNNKIWIIGGEDKQTQYSDVWSSTDGITWRLEKENLPFGKRSNSQVVNLSGKLFLLDNDVWTSTDALNWQKITDEIIPGVQIFGYTAVVFDQKIWLLGCNRNGQFTSQVLVSDDGRNWQGEDAPWLPRGGIAATAHQDMIIMTGGKYGGTPNHPDFRYDNDVWVMRKGD